MWLKAVANCPTSSADSTSARVSYRPSVSALAAWESLRMGLLSPRERTNPHCRYRRPVERVEAHAVGGAEGGLGGLRHHHRPSHAGDREGGGEPLLAIAAGDHAGHRLLPGRSGANEGKLVRGEDVARAGDRRTVRGYGVGDLAVLRDPRHSVVQLGQGDFRRHGNRLLPVDPQRHRDAAGSGGGVGRAHRGARLEREPERHVIEEALHVLGGDERGGVTLRLARAESRLREEAAVRAYQRHRSDEVELAVGDEQGGGTLRGFQLEHGKDGDREPQALDGAGEGPFRTARRFLRDRRLRPAHRLLQLGPV
jgi:hypothetical protein